MDVDKIADKHLKEQGRALRQDDEIHLVGKMIDAAVKEYMGVLGTNKVPTPLSEADMKALSEIMAKAAFEAVSGQMADLVHQIEIMQSKLQLVSDFVFAQYDREVQAINREESDRRLTLVDRLLPRKRSEADTSR